MATRFTWDRTAAEKIAHLPGTQNLLKAKALAIGQVAKAIFLAQVKHTHGVTFPPYANSFKIRRARRLARQAWQVYNDDPAAFWIEFGAYQNHPTHAPILKYRPLGRALDALRALE